MDCVTRIAVQVGCLFLGIAGLVIFSLPAHAQVEVVAKSVSKWDAWIECPGGKIRFGLEVDKRNTPLRAFLVNGPERIEVPKIKLFDGQLLLNIDHYDSALTLHINEDRTLTGHWTKRRGPDEVLKMAVGGTPKSIAGKVEANADDPNRKLIGKWQVDFESNQDPAVAIFKSNDGRILGTFLTTTGDYRYLDGTFDVSEDDQPTLRLSCFDGAHAFLFKAKLSIDGTLAGDFWSSNTWHESWTAKKDDTAQLPDSFKQTTVTQLSDLSRYRFPDLAGKPIALDDDRFAGKARIIYVFGSWCPNCHDAAVYFSQLQKEYADQGLSILGLAFELTGEHQRDAEQVRKYLKRHDCDYPVLIAGLADKKEASKALPILDRIRSYPTTIFLDGSNKVVAIHTGFSGPATGEAHEKLKIKFRQIIDRLLNSG